MMRTDMLRTIGALVLATLVVTAVAVVPSLAYAPDPPADHDHGEAHYAPASAPSQDAPPPPIAVEALTPRSDFRQPGTDFRAVFRVKLDGVGVDRIELREPSLTQVLKLTVQPGAQFPWHTHPGPVVVNVAQGELVYVPAVDCVHHSYKAGASFIDPGRGFVHTAYNPTDEEAVIVATFFELPAEGPATIPVDPPPDCDV